MRSATAAPVENGDMVEAVHPNQLAGGIGAGCAGTAARRLIAGLAEIAPERAAEGCAGRCCRASGLMGATVVGSDLMGAETRYESV